MHLLAGRRRTRAHTLFCVPLWLATTLSTLLLAAPASAATLAADSPVLAVKMPRSLSFGTYQPAFPNDLRSISATESAVGQRQGIIAWFALWGGWKREFSRSDLDAVRSHGSLPLITWEPWAGTANDPAWTLRKSVLSGANDAYIQSWAKGLASYGQPVLLRFAHEMHSQDYPWAVGVNGNTADDYVAAWKHVHDEFAAAGATNVRWVWNPNTLGNAPASAYGPIYSSLYPGDDYVDYLGLDIYNTGPNVDWGAPYWRSLDQILSEPYKAITGVSSKPLLLPEVGSAETGGSKGAWIADALQRLSAAYPQVTGLVWFDVNKEERWSLNSSQNAFSAWTSGLRNWGASTSS